MQAFVIHGGKPLSGTITLSGAKNVALKACVASLLTDDEVILRNVPNIRDFHLMSEVIKSLGVDVQYQDHVACLKSTATITTKVPLEVGARLRTSSLVLGPMLAKYGQATIPNPGGCRIGARPIDRHIGGLEQMGATISYDHDDGFFYAKAEHLHGAEITFDKNTHTGTETIILAAVLADGKTTIHNAAEEVEVDDLIVLLNQMGAHIKRIEPRCIEIEGVQKLHGTEFTIMPDRNEEVTWAIAAALTDGSITVEGSGRDMLAHFYDVFQKAGGGMESITPTITRYYRKGPLTPTDIETRPHPGFMTDWQAPWAVLMTHANGVSTIHETVFESRFSYVKQLKKMGAKIEFFDPPVTNPELLYNFHLSDHKADFHHAIRISGPTPFHNAVMEISDLRAGATLVLAALAARGESYLTGVEQIDRGYEAIEQRLLQLGADIKRMKEENV